MKKVVYTTLLGDYELKEPTCTNKDWDLICFTDRKRSSENWTTVYVPCGSNPRRKAREIKIRCDKFVDFDICLFIDAKFTVTCNLNDFVQEKLRSDIALMKHNKRGCVYDEAEFCIKHNIGNKGTIQDQVNSYREDGFPSGFGLYGTGILIRKNTPEVIEFMKQWYEEIEKYSSRDQISFSYVLWRSPIELSVMPFKETYSLFKK